VPGLLNSNREVLLSAHGEPSKLSACSRNNNNRDNWFVNPELTALTNPRSAQGLAILDNFRRALNRHASPVMVWKCSDNHCPEAVSVLNTNRDNHQYNSVDVHLHTLISYKSGSTMSNSNIYKDTTSSKLFTQTGLMEGQQSAVVRTNLINNVCPLLIYAYMCGSDLTQYLDTNNTEFARSLGFASGGYYEQYEVVMSDLYTLVNHMSIPDKLHSRLQYLSINNRYPDDMSVESCKHLGGFRTNNTEFAKIVGLSPEVEIVERPDTPPTKRKHLDFTMFPDTMTEVHSPDDPTPIIPLTTHTETMTTQDWDNLDGLLSVPNQPEVDAQWYQPQAQIIPVGSTPEQVRLTEPTIFITTDKATSTTYNSAKQFKPRKSHKSRVTRSTQTKIKGTSSDLLLITQSGLLELIGEHMESVQFDLFNKVVDHFNKV
jgi:hypothetical protein